MTVTQTQDSAAAPAGSAAPAGLAERGELAPDLEQRLRERLAEPESLRARKKLATRRALGLAAMRLAVERGLDNVVVEDIAAAAGVSSRTFNNYFASKYEAICSLAMDRGRLAGCALAMRPPGEPLMDAITDAVLEPYLAAEQAPPQEWLDSWRLVVRSPELQGEYLRTLHATQHALAEAITDRILATDPRRSMFPAILAGAVTSALQVALERWLASDPPTALAPLIRQALSELRSGWATEITPEANSVADGHRRPDPNQDSPHLETTS